MTTLLRPNSELVATAWLGGVTGLSPTMVSTQLPRDTATWKTSGFVTIITNGGSPSMYTQLRSPTFAVDCWAINPGSNKPPWFQANALAELIDQGCRDQNAQRGVTLPANYPLTKVTTAYLLSEPLRFYGDPGAAARYTFNLAINWVSA